MARATPQHKERVIKRYANRKLYDTATRRYVTLSDLAGLVEGGADLRVVDRKSGEDLTALVLAQVVLERIRARGASIPGELLARLIRLGSAPAAAWRVGPQQLAGRIREEAERIAGGLLSRGRLSLDEGLGLRQEIAGALHGLVREVQHGFEQRLHVLGARLERERGVQPALRWFREQLLAVEASLPRGKSRPSGRKRAATRSRQI